MLMIYYDAKVKKFHKLKLGQLIVDEYTNTFLELLRYVPFFCQLVYVTLGLTCGLRKCNLGASNLSNSLKDHTRLGLH